MDLTTTDILFGLGAVAAAVLAAGAVYWFGGRVTRPGPVPVSPAPAGSADPASAPPASAPRRATRGGADNARHRAPEELLRASTYRLSADRVARAKVQVPDGHIQSQAVPSPSRSRS